MKYKWIQTKGPKVTLRNSNTPQPSFYVPSDMKDGVLTFQLTVTDKKKKATKTVDVKVKGLPK